MLAYLRNSKILILDQFPYLIIQRLQYGLALLHADVVASRSFLVEHVVGGVVVDAYARAVEIAEAVYEGVEGELVRVTLVQHVATEAELSVRQAQLCQQRCGEVGLIGDAVHLHRSFHGTTRPYHRDAEEVRGEALTLLRVWDAVVGEEYYECVVPLRSLSELVYELSYAVVREGESVEMLVLELLERHFEWLMTAQRQERREPRLFLSLTFLEHRQQTLEGYIVWHAPLAVVAVVHGEVVLRCQLLETASHEITAHIGEVDVAAVEEVGLITRLA